jgi:hypothetical protein
MAYCHTCVPVALPTDELSRFLRDLIRGLGLEVEEQTSAHHCLYAADPPNSGRRLGEQVALVCDWSNWRNTGELELEIRSGESMALGVTRAETLFSQLCSLLQGSR